VKIAKRVGEIEDAVENLKPILSREGVLEEIKTTRTIYVDDSIYDYIASIVEESRKHPAN